MATSSGIKKSGWPSLEGLRNESKHTKKPLPKKRFGTKDPKGSPGQIVDLNPNFGERKEDPLIAFVLTASLPLRPMEPISKPTVLLPWGKGDSKRLDIDPTAKMAIQSMIGNDKIYRFRLGAVVTISSSGTGVVNSVLNASAVSSSTEFASFGALFAEFFVLRYRARFTPTSRYQYPLTGVTATSVANRMIGVCPLYHADPAYTTVSSMANNLRMKTHSTADPFTFTWVNNEDYRAGSAAGDQAWLLTSSGGSYLGQIQFLSNSAPPALPVSEVIGDITVSYDVLFRARS